MLKNPRTPNPVSENKSFVTYQSYLKIPELLSLQQPLSDPEEHDELLFIAIHQVYELWFKVILQELDATAKGFGADDLPCARRTLNRVLTILKVLVAQLDILETMTPREFRSFRDRLDSASGFQSVQFRQLEFLLGVKRSSILESFPEGSKEREVLDVRFSSPSLWHSFLGFLQTRGFDVPKNQLECDFKLPTKASADVQALLVRVYREDPDLADLCERLVDLDEGLQEWRYRHVKMVERTIGAQMGTGGSSGVEYLRRTVHMSAFPDLWAIRASL